MDKLPSMRSDPNQALIVSFPDENKAQEALETLKQLNAAHDVALSSAAVIRRDPDGKINIHETRDFNAKQGAVAGALAGGLIGLLRGNALAGAAIGTAVGFGASKVVDLGLPDDFLKQVGEQLTPGSSALVAIVTFEMSPRRCKYSTNMTVRRYCTTRCQPMSRTSSPPPSKTETDP